MLMTEATVIQGLFLGVIIAVLSIGYNKLVLGKFVKALIKADANHSLRAKSFEQLGINKNVFVNFALRKNGTLRRVVYETDDGGPTGRFYIPEDKLYRAGRMYGGKDVDMLMLAAILVILFIFFGLVVLYMPQIISAITGMFNS